MNLYVCMCLFVQGYTYTNKNSKHRLSDSLLAPERVGRYVMSFSHSGYLLFVFVIEWLSIVCLFFLTRKKIHQVPTDGSSCSH